MKKSILRNSRQNGYVALLSTIIIGAVLLVITIEAGQSGWHTRFMVLGRELKMQSRNLAYSCTNQTLSFVLTDTGYVGGATTTSETGNCYVYPTEMNYPTAGHLTIRTQADVQGSITNLVTEYDMNNFHLDSSPLPVSNLGQANTPDIYPVMIRQIEVPTHP
jgi:hypothetical protein